MSKIKYQESNVGRVDELLNLAYDNVEISVESITVKVLRHSNCKTYHEALALVTVAQESFVEENTATYYLLDDVKDEIKKEALRQKIYDPSQR